MPAELLQQPGAIVRGTDCNEFRISDCRLGVFVDKQRYYFLETRIVAQSPDVVREVQGRFALSVLEIHLGASIEEADNLNMPMPCCTVESRHFFLPILHIDCKTRGIFCGLGYIHQLLDNLDISAARGLA